MKKRNVRLALCAAERLVKWGVYKTWARPWPGPWPTLWPTLNFILLPEKKKEKRKEKRSTYAHGSSVKRSGDGCHVLYQTHPQALHSVTFQDGVLDWAQALIYKKSNLARDWPGLS